MSSPPGIVGLCGPNGSGKSTTYEALVEAGSIPRLPWLNADEMLMRFQEQPLIPLSEFGLTNISARKFNLAAEAHSLRKTIAASGHSLSLVAFGEPAQLATDENATAYEAALAAAVIRDFLIESGVSYAFETVMSHPSKLDLFRKAKGSGYMTQMIFVCTDDVELNVRRVAQRVREGGHDVEEKKIRSRYSNALTLLPDAAQICDVVILIDTTGDTRKIVATKTNGTWAVNLPTPNWAKETVSAKAFFDAAPQR